MIDLAQIASYVVSGLKPLAEARDCRLDVAFDRSEPFTGNPMAIRQAVRNLVENALLHTPVGTTVTITCGPGSSLTVEDSGPGIEGIDPITLLEPFHRGKTPADGAGLGLAIVKRAVDLHDGSIEIGHSLLGGARFLLHFPHAPRLKFVRSIAREGPAVS